MKTTTILIREYDQDIWLSRFNAARLLKIAMKMGIYITKIDKGYCLQDSYTPNLTLIV